MYHADPVKQTHRAALSGGGSAIDVGRIKYNKLYMQSLGSNDAAIFAGNSIEAMNGIQVLGLLAGSLTTAAFLPQVIKTWKSRSAKDLSLGMFSLFCLGVAMWLAYGLVVNDIPVIAANLLTLLLASTLLFFKLRFKE
jgi:MtN3 and saliva related transmembrane protein